MTKGSLKQTDKSNYFDVLKNFPDQVREACKIGEKIQLTNNKSFSNIVICGMGGSSISGQILSNYSQFTKGADHLRFHINQDYNVPEYIDNSFFGIVSSYSGNTEETISAYNELKLKTKSIFCVSSGGKLSSDAVTNNYTLAKVPGSFQPRAAIAYSFFPNLYAMMLSGCFKTEATQSSSFGINELFTHLDARSKIESQEHNDSSFKIAEELNNKIPVIFTSNRFKSISTRIQNQFHENVKIHSFGNTLPEMNHNHINSFDNQNIGSYNYYYLIIKDDQENERTQKRFQFLIDLLNEKQLPYRIIEPRTKNLLAKYFELIYLFDWVTYWQALIKGVDPTEIKIITELKNYLKK